MTPRIISLSFASILLLTSPVLAQQSPLAFIDQFVFGSSGGHTGITDITVGPDGLLYATSSATDEVLRYTAEGDFVDVFIAEGEGGLEDPHDLFFGPTGDLIVNSDNNLLLRYHGQTGGFKGGFYWTGSLGGSSSLWGATFGPDDNLYIALAGGGDVVRLNGETAEFIDIMVAPGATGTSVLGTPNRIGPFLAFSPNGVLYVGDWLDGTVHRFDAQTGAFIDLFVDNETWGRGEMNDIAVDANGHLYVASDDTQEVLKFDGTTGALLYVIPIPASYEGYAPSPENISFATDGTVLVSVNTVEGVFRFDPQTGKYLGPLLRTGLRRINSMAFGPDGNLYMAGLPTPVVQRYDRTTGEYLGPFVDQYKGIGTPYLLGTHLHFTFGPDEHLYVSDKTNNAILRFDKRTGAYIDTFISAGTGGLSAPEELWFDADGHLYVGSPTMNQILKFDGTTGAFLGVFVSFVDTGYELGCFALGPDGHLYACTIAMVHRFNGETGEFIDFFVPYRESNDPLRTQAGALVFDEYGQMYALEASSIKRFTAGTGTFIDTYPLDFPTLAFANAITYGEDGLFYVATWRSDVYRYEGPLDGDPSTLPVLTEDFSAPTSFAVTEVYPNPFSKSARITYSLPKSSEAVLTVYDLLGRAVFKTATGSQPAGTHSLLIDGAELPSGRYLYRLHIENQPAQSGIVVHY